MPVVKSIFSDQAKEEEGSVSVVENLYLQVRGAVKKVPTRFVAGHYADLRIGYPGRLVLATTMTLLTFTSIE